MTTRVAAISMCSGDSVEENLALALRYLNKAVQRGATWVVFPENVFFVGQVPDLLAAVDRGALKDAAATLISESKAAGVVCFLGTVPMRDPRRQRASDQAGPPPKLVSRLGVWGPSGELLGEYFKCHLFTLRDSQGQVLHDEGLTYGAGGSCVALKVDDLRTGLGICYDLRFSGMFLALERRGGPLDAIVLPSAFTFRTGEAHWELLLRARAIEHQCYVVGANQVGLHSNGKESWGHSLIVDPWGRVLDTTGGEPGMAIADISHDLIKGIRHQLNAVGDRRWDLY